MNPDTASSVTEICRYDGESYLQSIQILRHLYGDVYNEPPYCEDSDDVEDFIAGLPRRAGSPGFELVIAFVEDKAAGFAFGHQLPPDTRWWQGLTRPVSESLTHERPGRTYAIIELAVLAAYRRRGLASALHGELLAGRDEERVTLLVRPEAQPAHTAYERWGYARVGAIRPWPDAPLYDAMVRSLPLG